LVLVCLLSVLHAAVVRVDVSWNAIFPSSSWLQPGDILQFYGTNASESHEILTILPDFSGPNLTGQINSGPQPGIFTFNVTITDDRSQQGILWADVLNPASAGFGIVYVARTNDVFINWTVFQTHPPSDSGFALNSQYPLQVNITRGQRVVWDASLEPLLNHAVFFADRLFHATIGCPFNHPLVSNRNFHRFAWQFDLLGKFNFICGVHFSMNGTVSVCAGPGTGCLNIVRTCPYS